MVLIEPESPDVVAARLRQKIRSQAEDLLNKVDLVERRRSSSATVVKNNTHHENRAVATSTAAGGGRGLGYGAVVSGGQHPHPVMVVGLDEERLTQTASLSSTTRNSSGTVTPLRQPAPPPVSSHYHYYPEKENTTNMTTTTTNGRVNVDPVPPPPPVYDECNSITAATSTTPMMNGSTTGSASASSLVGPTMTHELTKRLQKLALERQKLNQDRLRVIQADASSHLSSVKTFQELNLPTHLLEAIFAMGFDRPSAIQEAALPRILADPPRNLIGQAQSGSGKTAAFTLGMLYRIRIDQPATTQALCVTPTRELAIQIVDKAVRPMAANMPGLRISLAIAGAQIERDAPLSTSSSSLSASAASSSRAGSVNAHLVVGTPGKLVDWLKRRIINAKTIKVFVLDEADHLVDESGHRANSLLLKKTMPPTCQCLLFSATFPPEVVQFASKMVERPDKILIEDGPEFLVLDVIKQLWVDTSQYPGGKLEFLADIYSLLTIGQSIVFVGTKKEADLVHATLTTAGYTCSILHAGVEASQRDSTMEDFRLGRSNVLITTNVLARGVDVDNVCLVVNYDVPVDRTGQPDYETYLHRIGRTGRFGRKGTAINLVSTVDSVRVLAAIEAHFCRGGIEMIAQAPADPEQLAELIEI